MRVYPMLRFKLLPTVILFLFPLSVARPARGGKSTADPFANYGESGKADDANTEKKEANRVLVRAPDDPFGGDDPLGGGIGNANRFEARGDDPFGGDPFGGRQE